MSKWLQEMFTYSKRFLKNILLAFLGRRYFVDYFVTLSATRLYGVDWYGDRSTLNLKEFGRHQLLPNRGHMSAFDWRDLVRPREISVIVLGAPAEAPTKHFAKMSIECYNYSDCFTRCGQRNSFQETVQTSLPGALIDRI
jgi:hypothetical protein